MADKAFIDTAVRLSKLYTEASKEPFPVREDAYPGVTREQVQNGEVLFGLNPYCDFPDEEMHKAVPVNRLHFAWEKALLRRLGPKKNVNAERIIILYSSAQHKWTDHDY